MEGNAHKRQRQNGMGGGSAGAGDTNQPYDRGKSAEISRTSLTSR